jgi:DamX protein
MSTSDDMQDDIDVYPFAPDAESDFYFAPPAIAQRLDLIQYLIEYSGQLLLIIGEHGAGKTAMIRQLLLRAGNVWRICHIEANAMLEARALQRRIGEAFDWVPREAELQDQALYLAGLQKKLEACEQANLVPVIVVDDAHELPAESLLFLFNLAKAEDQREQLHIALFCEPQINQMLNSPRLAEFKEKIMHVLDIPPLTEDQVLQYVEEKCFHAGLAVESPFSDEAMDQIQLRSKGLPGRINLLADQHMRGQPLNLPLDDTQPTHSSLPPLLRNRSQLLMLAALLGLVTVIIALNSLFSSVEQTDPDNTELASTPDPDDAQAGNDDTADPEADSTEPTAAEDSAEPTQPTARPTPTAPHAAAAANTGAVLPTNKPTPRPVPTPTPTPKPTPTPSAKPKPSPAVTPAPKRTPTEPSRALPGVSPVPTVPKPLNATPPDLPSGINGPDWLKAQHGSDFVIQLFGTHDRAALQRFVTDHGLHGHLAWFATNRDGKQWYVLVQGSFPDHNKAVSAIQSLPARVQAVKPWARSMAAVHAAMGLPSQTPPAATQPPVKPTPTPSHSPAKPKPRPKPTQAPAH